MNLRLGYHSYLLTIFTLLLMIGRIRSAHNYRDALSKSILFFEGHRSGRLPPNQRMTWRSDSALRDGFDVHVDLVGGYYDSGDNVKFNFPMAYSLTMLSWNILEFKKELIAVDSEFGHALEAVRWGTDYLLKATSVPGVVFAQVGDPYGDHNCWERPEDMDTARTPYAVTKAFPGSEVSAEMAAAMAAAAMVFRSVDRVYSARLLTRAKLVFEFADKYRGSYNTSLGKWVCPFYCDYSGYEDELLWGAAWLFKATKAPYYMNYVMKNTHNLDTHSNGYKGGGFSEFGWDDKHAGINVLFSNFVITGTVRNPSLFVSNADKFICAVLPESPSVSFSYSRGGLIFKPGGSNLQHATALSFLLVVYGRYMKHANKVVNCGNGVVATTARLIKAAKRQVDYILGTNPMKMSYMVGYGAKFPKRIHHRGSSLPSKDSHPAPLGCQGGSSYLSSNDSNPNLLIGAVVGGPYINDFYSDSRADFVHSEPTTYINAPLVGLLAYFNAHSLS